MWENTTAAYLRWERHSELTNGIKQPSGKGEHLIVTHCGNGKGFLDAAVLVICARKEVLVTTIDKCVPFA